MQLAQADSSARCLGFVPAEDPAASRPTSQSPSSAATSPAEHIEPKLRHMQSRGLQSLALVRRVAPSSHVPREALPVSKSTDALPIPEMRCESVESARSTAIADRYARARPAEGRLAIAKWPPSLPGPTQKDDQPK